MSKRETRREEDTAREEEKKEEKGMTKEGERMTK